MKYEPKNAQRKENATNLKTHYFNSELGGGISNNNNKTKFQWVPSLYSAICLTAKQPNLYTYTQIFIILIKSNYTLSLNPIHSKYRYPQCNE